MVDWKELARQMARSMVHLTGLEKSKACWSDLLTGLEKWEVLAK
jgi:hypothetical protein